MFRRKAKGNALLSVCPTDAGIAIARVQRENGTSPTLGHCSFEPLERDHDPRAALGKLVKAHDLDRFDCTSLMDLGAYSLLLVDAPDVPPTELRSAMRWRVKDLIDFHVDDAVIDVFEVADQPVSGRSRLMYAVVARSAVVKQRIDFLLDAGLKLSTVDIPELCMRNIAALLPEDVSGLGLVYLVGGGGLITLTHQKKLYLSRLVDAARGAAAAARAADVAEDETQHWLDGIVIEMQRSMDYYESHFAQPPIGNVVIAPMERPVTGIADYLAAQLGITVRMLDLNSVIDVAEPLDDALQFRCLLAIGAALRVEGKSL